MNKILLIFTALVLSNVFHGQTDQISGQYFLYKKNSNVATNVMYIDKIDEGAFEIRGLDWRGIGKIANKKGYYDFEFSNGDIGHTVFRIKKNGEIEGIVKFDKENLFWVNQNWTYVARRE